jgi:hypothetical protein
VPLVWPEPQEGNAHAVAGLGVLDARLHQASSRQRASNSRTGSSNPLSEVSPLSANRKPLPVHNSRTAFATSISPAPVSAAH